MARTRSPNFPVVDLESAVDLAMKLEKFAQRHPVPADSAVEKAWGMKPGGSYGNQCIAALRQFGLLQEEESASKRQVKLTEDAAKIVHNHPDRSAILRAAAIRPKVHANIVAKYPGELPPDDTIRTYLLFDHQPPFNPSSVGDFLSQLRKTLSYARLDLSGQKAENVFTHPNKGLGLQTPAGGSTPVVVGDLVQWEANGALKLESSRRVRAITEHNGAFWVFVDGSETGIPMEEVTIEKKGAADASKSPPLLPESGFVAQTDLAEREWLRGSLSKGASYRLIVKGDLGPKEIGKLITLLEAQRSVLSDDDEETKH